MTKFITLVAAALSLHVSFASAAPKSSSWYILSHGDRACQDASTMPQGMRTPYELEQFYRRMGFFSHTVVERDGDPYVVYAASVHRHHPSGHKPHMDFFRNLGTCEVHLIYEFGGVTNKDLN